MKQETFNFCIMLIAFAMLPSMGMAKKIQYGQLVTYNGKVNNDGLPDGKGTLETVFGKKDILTGVFSKEKVTEAELMFNALGKKLFLAKFEGTVEYNIVADGSKITYTLKDGKLTKSNGETFFIDKTHPFIVTRYPSANECKTLFEGKVVKNHVIRREVSSRRRNFEFERGRELYDSITKPLDPMFLKPLFDYNDPGRFYCVYCYYKQTIYHFEEDFSPIVEKTTFVMKCNDGVVVTRDKNTVSVNYPNDDYLHYEYGSGSITGFKKKLEEGTVFFEGELCMDFLSKSNEKGLATFKIIPELLVSPYGRELKNANSLKDLNMDVIFGQDAITMKTKLLVEGKKNLICKAIEDEKGSFSREEELINGLLAMEKSPEREEALLSIYRKLRKAGCWEVEYLFIGQINWHKGTERGKQELALAERIKKRMNEEGNKTFGFLPGQKEGDIVVWFEGNGILSEGTVLKKKNGVLTVDDNDGHMTFKMNDGTVFNGFFKEQVYYEGEKQFFNKVAPVSLLHYEELTPWDGTITYANGTTDKLDFGRSKKAMDKEKEKADRDAYETLCKQFGKQYIDAALKKQIIVGMPEILMVKTFDAKLYGQSGNKKTYRIYGYGSRERLDGSLYISKDHHLMTVWVSGGKVTSFRKWE